MNEADYIASGLKLRVTHNESIIEGIRELQRLALSVRRTQLKTNPIVRQHIPPNFTNGIFHTINIQVLNITLSV